MILSASRRTDIPAFFAQWLVNRLRTGRVAVRNPMNRAQVSVLDFDSQSVECLVFWTKNPAPLLPFLDEIDNLGYKYYFQFTLTPYGADLEPSLDKTCVIETFKTLSSRIGREKLIWRYDPIALTKNYTLDFHCEKFAVLSALLAPYTEKCVISFVDRYSFLASDFRQHGITAPDEAAMREIAASFSGEAQKHGLRLASCCERIALEQYGIERSQCIDAALIARITGRPLRYKKDPSQRPDCGCTASRDIGAYSTCSHACVYCYGRREKAANAASPPPACDPDSPLLCGHIDRERDKVSYLGRRSYPVMRTRR